MRKKTSKESTNSKEYVTYILEAILENKTLYVKDTGVKVKPDYFHSENRIQAIVANGGSNSTTSSAKDTIQICISEKPSMKALTKMADYVMRFNPDGSIDSVRGAINIENLSLEPYDTKAAKILYNKN